jgi:hypothetical protein
MQNIPYNCSVYNTLGQQIYFNSAINSIDISSNSKGLYFLNLETNNQTKTYKIILN